MHTGPLTLAPAKSAIKGTALVHADFIVTGVVMTMLGPMLPMFSARWLLNDAQAGYLFVAQFATSMLGMLLSGVLVEHLGYRRTLRIGLVLMAAGMAMLVRASWTLGLVAVSIYGVGFGSNTPAGNLFIADASPGNRAAALNLLNSSWGIGAMGCPLLIAWAHRSRHVPLFFDGTAAVLLGLAAWLSWVQFSADQKPARDEQPAFASAAALRAIAWYLLWPCCSLFMWERKIPWAAGLHPTPAAWIWDRAHFGRPRHLFSGARCSSAGYRLRCFCGECGRRR